MTVNTEELDVIIVDDVKYLDYGDASKYVGLTVGTLQQYVLKGLFHSTKLPGFKRTRKYLSLDQLEAYNGGEVNGYRGQSKVLPVTSGSPVPHHATPNGNSSAPMPGPSSGLASSYAYNVSMLYRHPSTYLLLLTMVDDMTTRGIPVADAYKIAFEVAPTLFGELDKEEDIMQKTPREIINKVTGDNHPNRSMVDSILKAYGVNQDRPTSDIVVPVPEELK
jgi:hypothetical protein